MEPAPPRRLPAVLPAHTSPCLGELKRPPPAQASLPLLAHKTLFELWLPRLLGRVARQTRVLLTLGQAHMMASILSQ